MQRIVQRCACFAPFPPSATPPQLVTVHVLSTMLVGWRAALFPGFASPPIALSPCRLAGHLRPTPR